MQRTRRTLSKERNAGAVLDAKFEDEPGRRRTFEGEFEKVPPVAKHQRAPHVLQHIGNALALGVDLKIERQVPRVIFVEETAIEPLAPWHLATRMIVGHFCFSVASLSSVRIG